MRADGKQNGFGGTERLCILGLAQRFAEVIGAGIERIVEALRLARDRFEAGAECAKFFGVEVKHVGHAVTECGMLWLGNVAAHFIEQALIDELVAAVRAELRRDATRFHKVRH
jgi:hypothetical protein